MNRRKFIKRLGLSSAFLIKPFMGFSVGPYYLNNLYEKIYYADVIIYGGTSAAITAAISVKRLGKKVIIVAPDKHLGGMTSGGLSFTDSGHVNTIGGLSKEFYHRVYQHYKKEDAWQWQNKDEFQAEGQGVSAIDEESKTMWVFEPHVAERVYEDFIAEYDIPVFREEYLNRREGGVEMEKGKIVGFQTLTGKKFKAKIFIDATYEGDLMAASGVDFFVGREGNNVYEEKWNGVQTQVFHHNHYFKNNIDPYRIAGDPSSGLLPFISSERPGSNGVGDNKIQAYCFRMCLTNNDKNRLPFPKPENYDPKDYELLIRVFDGGWDELFHKFDDIPNMKTDTNNHGPFSTDNIGMNYAYPGGLYDKRKAIIKQHEDYQKGLMYFLASDSKIPQDLQDEFNTWGLAGDEFEDNDNWPFQLYIREARRMRGEFVMTEREVLGQNMVKDPIGMGSYTLDSHNTQRYVDSNGFVQNEGDIGVNAPKPYGISYKSIVPKESDCENILVPVCASCSHSAYGSIRMEPVFMILGESAGTAAVLAIEDSSKVQSLEYNQLKEQLIKQNQILSI